MISDPSTLCAKAYVGCFVGQIDGLFRSLASGLFFTNQKDQLNVSKQVYTEFVP